MKCHLIQFLTRQLCFKIFEKYRYFNRPKYDLFYLKLLKLNYGLNALYEFRGLRVI